MAKIFSQKLAWQWHCQDFQSSRERGRRTRFGGKIRPPMLDISTYPAAKSKGLMTDPFLQKARNPIQIVSMLTASATSKQSKNPITNTQGRASRKPTWWQQENVLILKLSHPVVDSGFLRREKGSPTCVEQGCIFWLFSGNKHEKNCSEGHNSKTQADPVGYLCVFLSSTETNLWSHFISNNGQI